MAHVMRLARQRERDEQPVVAVGILRSRRLAVHRHDAAALLPRALGDELLEPAAERRKALAEEEGELVRALLRQSGGDPADAQGQVFLERNARVRREGDLARLLDQAVQVEAEQRGGDQAEVAEGAVAAADVRRVEERPPESVLLGALLQRRSRIGDGGEVRPVVHLPPEVPIEGVHLGGGAALRTHQEERLAQLESAGGRPHGVRRRRVEDAQIESPFPIAEDAREHLRRERGAAHAQEDAVPELLRGLPREGDRKSTRLNSSHVAISYAVFCLKKKKQKKHK